MAVKKKVALTITSFRVNNFKAIRDSGIIKFTPLTVFIGNNGSGKSSMIEAMETVSILAREGLNAALNRWGGFDPIWNKAVNHDISTDKSTGEICAKNPMHFRFICKNHIDMKNGYTPYSFIAETNITTGPGNNEIFLLKEIIDYKFAPGSGHRDIRTRSGNSGDDILSPNRSLLSQEGILQNWQFLRLNPEIMGFPQPANLVMASWRLNPDGSNIGDYLLNFYNKYPEEFAELIEALRYVLPYASDLTPAMTSELTRNVYLQLTESGFKVPGWLLSTGTLRIVALLAVLRHPESPPLICIEELENGLDPRTIHLIVEEIRSAVEYGGIQVIITTHSPYLLNLLSLSQIIVVERVNGEPHFYRPSDSTKLDEWKNRFAPGELYTMGQLRAEAM